MSRPAMSANVAKELAAATSFFDSTIVLARVSRPQGPRGDQLAIALGYLERLRLGLGSPFRLADEALADPRLSATMGNSVAWAVLGRLRRGDAYVVDKSVLDDIGPWTSDGSSAHGSEHLLHLLDAWRQTRLQAIVQRVEHRSVRLRLWPDGADGFGSLPHFRPARRDKLVHATHSGIDHVDPRLDKTKSLQRDVGGFPIDEPRAEDADKAEADEQHGNRNGAEANYFAEDCHAAFRCSFPRTFKQDHLGIRIRFLSVSEPVVTTGRERA